MKNNWRMSSDVKKRPALQGGSEQLLMKRRSQNTYLLMQSQAPSSTTRNRGGWSKTSEAYLQKVCRVLEELRDYWPLTLRQVYYQLVAAGFIPNSRREYQKLSRVLAKARLDNLVSWESIEDRARSMIHSAGWKDKQEFIEDQLNEVLSGYRRDLLQTQSCALEVWVEKDALSRICHKVAFPYCIPVIVARGFSSVSYLNECRNRVEHNVQSGKQTQILYFGDLDPSGWAMLPAMLETLQDEMRLGDLVEGCRCALTIEQVKKYHLPCNPDALKPTDSRAKKYMEKFGDVAVELDALPPSTLESLVKESIEVNLDLSKIKNERELEKIDLTTIAGFREKIAHYTERNLP